MNLTDDSLLQAHFKIIAVDRLGYGKSEYGKEELSTQLQALAIKSIIEKENASQRKVSILGRSYGAPIAAWLAINYPQNYEKLIMVSPVIDPEKEKFYWFSAIGKSPVVQWMLPDLLNVATREKYSHQQEMKKMAVKWNKLYIPTYVLVGGDDQVADTSNYSFAKKHLVNCQAIFMKIKHTGHLVTYQQPDLVKQILTGSNGSFENLLARYSGEAEIAFNNLSPLPKTSLRAEKSQNGHTLLKTEESGTNSTH